MTSNPPPLTPSGPVDDTHSASRLQGPDVQRQVHLPEDNTSSTQSMVAMPPRPGYRDATAQLLSACSQLRDGQMVAVPDFTLMDSMAAVKIMDARMDSGMQLPATELPESDRLDGSMVTSSTDDFDAFKPLTVPDALWIMDRLLACEAAWHQGSALSQTLYTCLYFHAIKSLSHKHPRFQPPNDNSEQMNTTSDPEAGNSSANSFVPDRTPPQLVYKVLRAFILGTVKAIDVAWSELTSKQHFHDGEDYSSDKNGLSLLETTDTGCVVAELDDALEWVQSQQAVLPSDYIESLRTRLSFRKQMLYAARLLQSPAEAAPIDVVMHTKFARRSWSLLNPASDTPLIPTDASPSRPCLDDNMNGRESKLISLQPPNRNAAPSSAAIAAFDPAYNRRLAWCQALRPISLPSAEHTWRILNGILDELQDVVRVLQRPGFLSWKIFFTHRAIDYQSSQPLSATPYVRSLMQTAICDRNMIASRLPLEWIAEAFFQEIALIDPLLLRRASRIGRNSVEGGSQTMWNAPPPLGQRIHYFQQRISGQLVQYLTTLSQNRSRCKRTLASRLYREWVNISEEASDIGRRLEECLAPGERYIPDSLFAATQHVSLEIMTQITLSGFELDLYSSGTDSESMWWLASRIQVEQKMVCTDLRDELSSWLEQAAPDKRPRGSSSTILYLSRQILLAQALEQLSIGTTFLMQLSVQQGGLTNGKKNDQPVQWSSSRKEDPDGLELAAAVFASRTKWMRTNAARANDREASDQDDPCETLWQDYLSFSSELHATAPLKLLMVAKERLDEAILHLQHLAGTLTEEKGSNLGEQGFNDFVASLFTTAHHNREVLEQVADSESLKNGASDDRAPLKGSKGKALTEWVFEHPWFPKWMPDQGSQA
ncbi:NatC N(alpha)-terminal acetyltransferase, Mak10 subunit [Kalmanozyma brasiliensis GHG001]|uniref:NatC N(alpha)-terminal acetyltransferase, Mak10 subunit n=1 Tax=Kalmanozyma brasiliensis (strain GHG001) TaxID=1365824 RepID=UPI002868274D|nr:NatC N(alpha)-terminal acetyltransferase, Mak10 subunit [Kalmanozyma brasiliensis GHG001]EST10228.2 NatC N(alpha)-terminal acetyltransferase, Mak10 subunit [Kalmanozyma brasiliensis GHG001]